LVRQELCAAWDAGHDVGHRDGMVAGNDATLGRVDALLAGPVRRLHDKLREIAGAYHEKAQAVSKATLAEGVDETLALMHNLLRVVARDDGTVEFEHAARDAGFEDVADELSQVFAVRLKNDDED
jgi:hypothetical protein